MRNGMNLGDSRIKETTSWDGIPDVIPEKRQDQEYGSHGFPFIREWNQGMRNGMNLEIPSKENIGMVSRDHSMSHFMPIAPRKGFPLKPTQK